MLPSFEKKLENLKKGDKFDFVLTADEAYGQPDPENVIELPKDIFMVDGKFDDEMVVEGAVLPMRDAQGNTLEGTVEKITETGVVMDFNHPMAGIDLHFIGEVLEVREPTEEDVHACTGGCGGCGCDGCGDNAKGGCGEGGCCH
jgi:FKBP-type peptidyl-prolyl cis-trans isomerases 2